jgi:2'-5' RNA ligase
VEELQKAIEAGFLALGLAGEDRPFHPHLTIGRVSELSAGGRKQLAEGLAIEREHEFGEWEAGRVDLMQSVLSAQGAAYSTVRSIALQ